WLRRYCPTCGSLPAVARLVGIDPVRVRFLSCGCCATRWRYRRTGCPFCENEDEHRLGSVAVGGEAAVPRPGALLRSPRLPEGAVGMRLMLCHRLGVSRRLHRVSALQGRKIPIWKEGRGAISLFSFCGLLARISFLSSRVHIAALGVLRR